MSTNTKAAEMLDFSKRNSHRRCGKFVESSPYFAEEFFKMGKKQNSQHSLWKINRAGNSICFALKLKEKMLTFFCCCVWSLAWKLPFC